MSEMVERVARIMWTAFATEAQYEALSATGKVWRDLDSKTVWQTYIDAALGAKPSGD